MTRNPYLVLRDFRVWFPKRRGFLAALRKTDPAYVRAVDGIERSISNWGGALPVVRKRFSTQQSADGVIPSV